MPGLYFEDLEPGSIIDHQLMRTMTEMDATLFSSMTFSVPTIHHQPKNDRRDFDAPHQPVDSQFILGLVTGIAVSETTFGTSMGNLSYHEIRFPHPVLGGDTLGVRTEVLEKRESKSRPGSGIVQFRHLGINQDDDVVCDCRRVALVLKRPEQTNT